MRNSTNYIFVLLLTIMCAYVSIISGVIILLFTLQGYKDWINIQYLAGNGICIGLILCILGYYVFCMMKKYIKCKK